MDVGRTQTLKVMGPATGGWWLGDRTGAALLTHRLAPEGVETGARLEVFVYTDREGLPLASPTLPKVEVGRFAALDVVDVVAHGAYLAWGLERDLFVPHALMHRPLEKGDRAVVTVGVDKEGRLYGTTRLAEHFQTRSGLVAGDTVDLLVYGENEVGILAVVNRRYSGLMYHNETFRSLAVGEMTQGWVKAVRGDGRLDLTLHRSAREGTADARAVIWDKLQAGGGFLALTDRSDPRAIEDTLQMSKKAFKKAVGALYKERRITLEEGGIRVVR